MQIPPQNQLGAKLPTPATPWLEAGWFRCLASCCFVQSTFIIFKKLEDPPLSFGFKKIKIPFFRSTLPMHYAAFITAFLLSEVEQDLPGTLRVHGRNINNNY